MTRRQMTTISYLHTTTLKHLMKEYHLKLKSRYPLTLLKHPKSPLLVIILLQISFLESNVILTQPSKNKRLSLKPYSNILIMLPYFPLTRYMTWRLIVTPIATILQTFTVTKTRILFLPALLTAVTNQIINLTNTHRNAHYQSSVILIIIIIEIARSLVQYKVSSTILTLTFL